MTPAARAAAAAALLDRVLAGEPAAAALLRWARSSRFAGSGDRAAVRDLVHDALRRRQSRAVRGGARTGRGLILGMCRETGIDPDTLFGAGPHALAPLSPDERAAGREPDEREAMDLPDWLLPQLEASLGPDLAAVAATLRHRAPVWLRANALRAGPGEAAAALAAEAIATEPAADLATALRVTAGERRVAASRAYREGLVELQDLSPQLAVAALGALDRQEVLDFCAGGGGKALALAAAGAKVVAHDAEARRMADLPARADRAGARLRIAAPGTVAGRFDLVVADVPCSGSGSWRRDPAGKWRLTPDHLAALNATQDAILDAAARHVRPGGRLAYMTCSLLEAENGERLAAFLGRQDGFVPLLQRRMTPLAESDGFFLGLLGHEPR